jgi:hypothetical protein
MKKLIVGLALSVAAMAAQADVVTATINAGNPLLRGPGTGAYEEIAGHITGSFSFEALPGDYRPLNLLSLTINSPGGGTITQSNVTAYRPLERGGEITCDPQGFASTDGGTVNTSGSNDCYLWWVSFTTGTPVIDFGLHSIHVSTVADSAFRYAAQNDSVYHEVVYTRVAQALSPTAQSRVVPIPGSAALLALGGSILGLRSLRRKV